MKRLFNRFAAAKEEGSKIWDDRTAITSEARRAFKQGPAKFQQADTRSKAVIIAIIAMISFIIYRTF